MTTDHEWVHRPDSDEVHPETQRGLERTRLVDLPRYTFITPGLRRAFESLALEFAVRVSFSKRSVLLLAQRWAPYALRFRLGDGEWAQERVPHLYPVKPVVRFGRLAYPAALHRLDAEEKASVLAQIQADRRVLERAVAAAISIDALSER